MKICIDAGHYCKYNRSNVYPSYYESDMTWKLHLMLKKELEAYGFEVVTTRADKNIDLPLDTRGVKSKGCDLFISLHSNACDTESVDRAVVIPYQDVSWTTIDDTSRAISEKLGACITDVMDLSSYQIYPRKAGNDRDGNGKLDDEYYGVLYGARKVGTPGVIIEHGFHTNKKCAKWLSDDSNLEKLAKAEAKVIADYFDVKRKITTDNEPSEWSKKAIEWAVNNEILQGDENGDYKLREPCTTERFITLLHRALNKER